MQEKRRFFLYFLSFFIVLVVIPQRRASQTRPPVQASCLKPLPLRDNTKTTHKQTTNSKKHQKKVEVEGEEKLAKSLKNRAKRRKMHILFARAI